MKSLVAWFAGLQRRNSKSSLYQRLPARDFDRSLQVNLVGYFLCAREFRV